MFHNSNYNTNFTLKWSTFDNPAPRYQKPYNVCVSQWTPMIDCAGRVNPNEWAGYQIEMNRIMARDLGWADDDWFMHCVQWTPMLEDLVDPNGNCIMAAAGVEVILENYDMGLKFSAPVYKSGLQVRPASCSVRGSRIGERLVRCSAPPNHPDRHAAKHCRCSSMPQSPLQTTGPSPTCSAGRCVKPSPVLLAAGAARQAVRGCQPVVGVLRGIHASMPGD
jgi:hypothetical protein